MFLSRELCDDHTITEHRLHHFVTEASDLGWKAGQAPPQEIETNLGNGQNLILMSADENEFNYSQQLGCLTLRVFND